MRWLLQTLLALLCTATRFVRMNYENEMPPKLSIDMNAKNALYIHCNVVGWLTERAYRIEVKACTHKGDRDDIPGQGLPHEQLRPKHHMNGLLKKRSARFLSGAYTETRESSEEIGVCSQFVRLPTDRQTRHTLTHTRVNEIKLRCIPSIAKLARVESLLPAFSRLDHKLEKRRATPSRLSLSQHTPPHSHNQHNEATRCAAIAVGHQQQRISTPIWSPHRMPVLSTRNQRRQHLPSPLNGIWLLVTEAAAL